MQMCWTDQKAPGQLSNRLTNGKIMGFHETDEKGSGHEDALNIKSLYKAQASIHLLKYKK